LPRQKKSPGRSPFQQQLTLDGRFLPALPKVRTTDGHMVEWERERIVRMLREETRLIGVFYGHESATEEKAREIAALVEQRILKLGLQVLSGPLIREITNIVLLEQGLTEYRNVCTRVGTPVYDAHLIDVGRGFEAHDNANLQENAETSHKKKADKISKEQYLLQLPPHLADYHLGGDLHIHDLEYFGTRPFCQDWDLRYFLYYGLMPDGNGTKASVAGPAKRAEVAVLHAVKALGSAQTNFAGGQGYYNFLTFLAPYFEGLEYEQIKQLIAERDRCLMRQIFRIGQEPTLVRRILVENVDRLTEELVGFDRQKMLELSQRLQARPIDERDLEGGRVAGHDVDRHAVEHLSERGALVLGVL